MALYNWKDGELVTAEKLNAYGEGMEQLKADTELAKTGAEAAKTAAAASASTAESEAERAEAAVAHNPIVQDGIWYVWDQERNAYVTTGVPATGEMTVTVTYQQGDSPVTLPTGEWVASPPEVAQGKYLWTKALFSDGTAAYSIARQGMDGEGAVISVNGKSGEVTLTTDDIDAGKNKYVTQAEKEKIGNLPENVKSELEKKADAATALTGSVGAGETEIQFTNEAIKGTSAVDIYASIYDVMIEDMQISEGSVKLKIEAQESAVSIRIEVH